MIKEAFEGKDVYDFAVYVGMLDAAINKRNNPFKLNSPVANKCKDLYELAFDMEQHTGIFALTSPHEVEAFVRKYDLLHGQGLVEFVEAGKIVQLYFNYTALDADQDLGPGELVIVTYKWSEDEVRKVLSIRNK